MGGRLYLSADGNSVLLQAVGPWITEPELRYPDPTGRLLGYSSLTGKQLFDVRVRQIPGVDLSELRFKCMTPDQVVFLDAIGGSESHTVIVHGLTGQQEVVRWIDGPCMFLDK
jgi:hypothetical protein